MTLPNYRQLLEQMPVLVFATAADGVTVTFYNKTFIDHTGFTKEELSEGWKPTIHPEDLDGVVRIILNGVEQKDTHIFELRIFCRPLNAYRWFLCHKTPVFTDEGEIDIWVGTLTDINDSKLSWRESELKYKKLIDERVLKIRELEEELNIHKSLGG